MTTDRELLVLAAKAAGIAVNEHIGMRHDYFADANTGKEWNPLTDDGDGARLEAALGMSVNWYGAMVLVGPNVRGIKMGSQFPEYFEKHGGDKQAARRRAGLRAAASIGESMP